MGENYLHLDHQLCFPVYALAREIINSYRPFLEELQVTYPQYLVLLTLWEEEPLRVKKIGQRLHLDTGTLTPLLKRMEQKQLLIRHRCPLDERSVEISLTPRGRQMHQKALEIPEQLLNQLPVAPEELQILKKIATKILDQLHTDHPTCDHQ